MAPPEHERDALTRGGDEHNAYLESIGKIFFHVYASTAVELFPADELRILLQESRRRNAEAGVTGMLLYKNGNFLQVLEGREAAVLEVVERVYRNPRHRDVTTLSVGFEDEYQFPDWSMGFHDLLSAETKAVTGFNNFLETSLAPASFASDPTLAQRLLLTFKKLA